MFEDDELDEMEDILILDEHAQEVWGGIFEVATPEETAKAFGKVVLDEKLGKFYKPD